MGFRAAVIPPEARLKGEALAASLPEGVLNPIDGGVEPMAVPSEARL